MTNIFKTPKKILTRHRLFQIGVESLQKEGWTVERIEKIGKASVRRITKAGQHKVVAIRTTQDAWVSFPRAKGDESWVTLSDVDAVVAVSVDDKHAPQAARVHMIEGVEMRERFDRAYKARMDNNYSIPVGRGVWVSLYDTEDTSAPLLVGAGAGLENPAFATVPLEADDLDDATDEADDVIEALATKAEKETPLTIPQAKRRLALTFGVDPSNIKITVVDD